MGVKVEAISFKGQDERGMTTEIGNLDRNGPYILAYRFKGYSSGNHYHKGLSPLKDPEVVFLLTGKAELEHGKVAEGRVLERKTLTVEAPARIEIAAFTWHKLTFLEDACFVELNSFAEGDKDTFRLY